MQLTITPEVGMGLIGAFEKCEEYVISPACPVGETCPPVEYYLSCFKDWDTSDYQGKKVTLTTTVKNVDQAWASDSVTVYVGVPLEPGRISVKAYDAETGELVEGATSIILKYLLIPIPSATVTTTTQVRGVATAERPSLTGRVVGGSEAAVTPSAGGGPVARPPTPGGGAAEVPEVPVPPPEQPPEVPGVSGIPYPSYKVVVGIITANGIDSISLDPGIYDVITYAKDYTLYEYSWLEVGAGREYNLYAPMSKRLTISINVTAPVAMIRPIVIKEKGMIKIMPEAKEKEIETITPMKKVTIRPVEVGKPGKFIVEDEGAAAVSKEDVEIEENKLYIKAKYVKEQVKVLPSTASERAREAVTAHKIKNITLEIVEKKPIYAVKAEQEANLLGFIPVKVPVEVEVRADTGDIKKMEKPWWSSLAIPKPAR
jgi:hypothetical protein